MRYWIPTIALSFLTLGCEEDRVEPPLTTEPAPPERTPTAPVTTPKVGYQVVERTPAELDAEIAKVCSRAVEEKKRVLLEFSAAWCGDCRKLAEMKTTEVLRKEMNSTPHVVVNVGRFNRHENLLKSFGIRAIANWQVVEPTDCSTPVDTWKRVAHRTLEPQSGRKKVSADELAMWLKKFVPQAG